MNKQIAKENLGDGTGPVFISKSQYVASLGLEGEQIAEVVHLQLVEALFNIVLVK